jgi:hypothetical protein
LHTELPTSTKEHPLLRLVLNCSYHHGQVPLDSLYKIVDAYSVQHAVGNHYDNTLMTYPEAPASYELMFDQATFMRWVRLAEPGLTRDFPEVPRSFLIMAFRCHELIEKQVKFIDFMAGFKQPVGMEKRPGIELLYIMSRSLNDEGIKNWNKIEGTLIYVLTGRLVPEKAEVFVNELPTVDVATMVPMERCPFCWADFDEVNEGTNHVPKQLPCHPSHRTGHNCLVHHLVSSGPKCSLCQTDIVKTPEEDIGPYTPAP